MKGKSAILGWMQFFLKTVVDRECINDTGSVHNMFGILCFKTFLKQLKALHLEQFIN